MAYSGAPGITNPMQHVTCSNCGAVPGGNPCGNCGTHLQQPVVVAFDIGQGSCNALIGGDGVRRAPVEGVPDGLAFSRDGRIVYASDVYGGAVTAVDVESGAVLAVIPVGEGTGAMLVVAR